MKFNPRRFRNFKKLALRVNANAFMLPKSLLRNFCDELVQAQSLKKEKPHKLRGFKNWMQGLDLNQ